MTLGPQSGRSLGGHELPVRIAGPQFTLESPDVRDLADFLGIAKPGPQNRAPLREREAGTAEVLDSDGNTLPYESPDSARAALMDAEFVALDGLDADDSAQRGFDLDELRPPAGGDDALRERMVQQFPQRH